MIELGCHDAGVSDAACQAYCAELERLTQLKLAEVKPGIDKIQVRTLPPDAGVTMTIAEVQQGLKQIGFFPGAGVDGICGYRTQSAIRLFQEYLRSFDGQAGVVPDGRFGPITQGHLRRWLDQGLQTAWAPTIEAWRAGTPPAGEYTDWLGLIAHAKESQSAAPSRLTQMVGAFGHPTDTPVPAKWDTSGAGHVHLVGIRREQITGKFDDLFVLLVKGLVFKFQGSTEPGATQNPKGLPFLVPGQHDYRFGWHKSTYLALRPLSAGVLVVRSADKRLDEGDLAHGLEANTTINIHWGGRGQNRDVATWSEGCQVINGSVYIAPNGELIDCTAFAAVNQDELQANPQKTRGAFNVVVDLVTALASDLPGNTVKYTLLAEADLAMSPPLAERMASHRERVARKVGLA
jgi:peptidoglycan hydrolase-like protein with peptidoglycan-binding domain